MRGIVEGVCVCVCLCTPAVCISHGLTFISFIPLSLKINKTSSLPPDRRRTPRVSEVERSRKRQ